MKIAHIVTVPRNIEYLRPCDYRSMRTFGEKVATSLDVPVMKRFPMQPPMPEIHPAMNGDSRLEQGPTPTGNLWMTDAALWAQFLQASMESNEKMRVLQRFALARNDSKRQMVKAMLEEEMWQQFYYKRQSQNMKELTYIISTAFAKKQLLYYLRPDWGFVVNAYGKTTLSPLDERGKPFANHVVLGVDPKKDTG